MEIAAATFAAGHMYLVAEEEAAVLRKRIKKIRTLIRKRAARRRALLAFISQLVSYVMNDSFKCFYIVLCVTLI